MVVGNSNESPCGVICCGVPQEAHSAIRALLPLTCINPPCLQRDMRDLFVTIVRLNDDEITHGIPREKCVTKLSEQGRKNAAPRLVDVTHSDMKTKVMRLRVVNVTNFIAVGSINLHIATLAPIKKKNEGH